MCVFVVTQISWLPLQTRCFRGRSRLPTRIPAGEDHQLRNKTGFPPAPGRTPTRCPPPRLGRRRARVRTRRYLWIAGGTPSVHSGRFPPLPRGCYFLSATKP
eukprot:scaffold8073_cov68-Phaeocystis_antarctica.AAC.1